MAYDNIIRDLHALEPHSRNSLSSLHAPRRPIVDAYKRLIKDMEDEAIAADAGRAERLTGAGIPTEREWPDKHLHDHHEGHSEEHPEEHSTRPLDKLVEGFTKLKGK